MLFEKNIRGAFGEDGAQWLCRLDDTIKHYLDKWSLVSEGPVENLSYNYVLRVRDLENNPFILKLGVPNFDFTNEYRTLRRYDGQGCVRVIKEDATNGAFLLEKLEPGHMLLILDEELAVKEFAKVWRKLRKPIELNDEFPRINQWFHAFDNYLKTYPKNDGPILTKHVRLAKTMATDLLQSTKDHHLLHGDLHHQNILYSDMHGWIAIDPKGVIGDKYFDLVSFLINELFQHSSPKEVLQNRVDMLVEGLNLQRERLLQAGIVMGILYACWAVEDKAEWEEAYQCAEWFDEFGAV